MLPSQRCPLGLHFSSLLTKERVWVSSFFTSRMWINVHHNVVCHKCVTIRVMRIHLNISILETFMDIWEIWTSIHLSFKCELTNKREIQLIWEHLHWNLNERKDRLWQVSKIITPDLNLSKMRILSIRSICTYLP